MALSSPPDWASSSLRRASSSWACLSSVTLRATVDAPTTFPWWSRTGETLMDTSTAMPSLRSRWVT